MADDVEKLPSVGNWWHLLSIKKLAIHMLRLKMLASFEFDRSYNSFSSIDAIQFCAFGQYHSMSITQFSVKLGLYYDPYIDTKEYEQLSTDYRASLTPQCAYRALCGQGQYKPGVPKATCLSWLAYRYIHAILSRLVNGCGDNTGNLRRQELLYLYFMVQSEPIHLRHILAEYLCHQDQYARVGVIF